MMQMLETVLMFNCKSCERYWSLEELNLHKVESRCVKDTQADNSISKLAIREVKQPKKPEIVQ